MYLFIVTLILGSIGITIGAIGLNTSKELMLIIPNVAGWKESFFVLFFGLFMIFNILFLGFLEFRTCKSMNKNIQKINEIEFIELDNFDNNLKVNYKKFLNLNWPKANLSVGSFTIFENIWSMKLFNKSIKDEKDKQLLFYLIISTILFDKNIELTNKIKEQLESAYTF
ncbi:hypothetical protein GE118_00205 [Mycoplasma sp. NEAQ87857]|uniref:hypothetical protein n=1 Tax=Mycoplasma sp. NEAQ87857 TaxID=2683967 RepID=UPI0013162BDA|nr:hypothetical protein [Mycoplasma sp. NEAQ87857]QGZ97225.1 hypothetical protein GE118_00205 [Mycoplasma sp. NEAQ87857]